MSFGDNLKRLRMAKGLSQQELGKIFGLSDRTIGHYEANKRFPKSAQLLMSMARYFEVPIDYLLDYEVPPTLSIEEFYDQARVHFSLATEKQQLAMFQTLTMIYYESWKKEKTDNS
ncbi:MAG: helix-turn-helix transcriptional regulator [Cellulosilyticum sp.]|nr:helix-turn-helix transcriptional regulator [Cellulosilyticum sp.]